MSEKSELHLELLRSSTNGRGIQSFEVNVDAVSELMAQHSIKSRRQMGDDLFIRSYLQDDEDEDHFDFVNESQHYDDHESAIKRYCAMKVIDRLFKIKERKWIEDWGMESSARWQTVEIHRDMKISIPKQMYCFMESKIDDSKWIIRYMTWDDDCSQITIFTRQSQAKVNELWKAFDDYFCEEGPLRGECFTPEWKYVKSQNKTWDDVILSEEVKDKIMLNGVDFFSNLKKYEEYGLKTNRGILLAGHPGTGKTLTVDVIMNQFDGYTRIYATAETLCGRHLIREMYAVARKLSPAIIFIEDIDTIGSSDDDEAYRTPLLGEILTALNSVEKNDNILTIATTNYPDSLDIALRDRPGRFDCRINFEMPDKKGREGILKHTLQHFNFKKKDVNMKDLVSATDGFSGAWITELVQTAFSYALRDDDENPSISRKNLNSALKVVKENRTLAMKRDEGNNPMY